MLNYSAVNKAVAAVVPSFAQSILDVGCGDGSLGLWLKQRQHASIHGITFSHEEAQKARTRIDGVEVADLNSSNAFEAFKNQAYDCIICSHVLEHLYEPWDVVMRLQELLRPNGLLIIAIPNVLFFKQRLQFLLGRFTYNKAGGLMDETHFRFFDWKSAEQLLDKSNLTLVAKSATGMFPQPIIRSVLPSFCKRIDQFFVKLFPGLFGLQFLMTAAKTEVENINA